MKSQIRGRVKVRDVDLFVDVVGSGPPLLLMHGGPSLDHYTLWPLREIADRFTLVFYDHRCNGRSTGTLESLTWDNLTADADALRDRLGIDRWSVLGHSFGGHVALEYALRFPGRLSSLVLMDTAADSRWSQQNAPLVAAARGFNPQQVELVRRWFNGDFAPGDYMKIFMRIWRAYSSEATVWPYVRDLVHGEWRSKVQPATLIYAARHVLRGWSVVDRLVEITAPTLVIAGRDDFVFPPQAQEELAAGIRDARLRLIDRAGHNPQSEQPATLMDTVTDFLSGQLSRDVKPVEAVTASGPVR